LLPIPDVRKQTCIAVLGMPSSKIYIQFCFLVIYFIHVHVHTM